MLRLALALALLAPASASAAPAELTPPEPGTPLSSDAAGDDLAPRGSGTTFSPDTAPADPMPPEPGTTYSPDASQFGAYLRGGYLWITDPRFDLVGDEDVMDRFELGASWSPAVLANLAFELGYAYGRVEAPLFDFGNAALDLHSIQASALYLLPISAVTRAFARCLGSLDFAKLEITGDGAETALQDTELLLGLEGTLGWELLIPLGKARTAGGHPRTHLAFGVEAGYSYRPFEADFELERSAKNNVGPGRIDRAPIDVGAMDLSAWVLRLGGALRF